MGGVSEDLDVVKSLQKRNLPVGVGEISSQRRRWGLGEGWWGAVTSATHLTVRVYRSSSADRRAQSVSRFE